MEKLAHLGGKSWCATSGERRPWPLPSSGPAGPARSGRDGASRAEKGEGAPGGAPSEGSPGAAGPGSALPVPTANPRPLPPGRPCGPHPEGGALTPGPAPGGPAPPLSAGTPLPAPRRSPRTTFQRFLQPLDVHDPRSRPPAALCAAPLHRPPPPRAANGLPAPLAQTQPGLSNLPTWRPGRPRARPRQPALLPAGGRWREGGGAARALREAGRGGPHLASGRAGGAGCRALREQEGKLRQISYVGNSDKRAETGCFLKCCVGELSERTACWCHGPTVTFHITVNSVSCWTQFRDVPARGSGTSTYLYVFPGSISNR